MLYYIHALLIEKKKEVKKGNKNSQRKTIVTRDCLSFLNEPI